MVYPGVVHSDQQPIYSHEEPQQDEETTRHYSLEAGKCYKSCDWHMQSGHAWSCDHAVGHVIKV